MPRIIICEWDCCKFCGEDGCCECVDDVVLVEVMAPRKGSLMECKNFEWDEEAK